MKILLKEPDGPYHCDLDTDVMDVEIREAYLGAVFVAEDGQKLSVCMRDGGFQIRNHADFGTTGFNSSWIPVKDGVIGQPICNSTNGSTSSD